jgi:solute carrier family 39 (zinc transporter), member 1/2/3
MAFESLTDPCLPWFFSEGYTPLPGFVAMVSAIVVVGVESYLTARGAGHSHSHAHNFWEGSDSGDETSYIPQQESGGLAERRRGMQRPGNIMLHDAEASQGLVAGVSPLPESSPAIHQNGKKLQDEEEGDFHDGDSDLDLEMDELHASPGQGGNSQYAALNHSSHHRDEPMTPQTLSPDEQHKKMLQCMLLEAGILFHSVFIGMAISVATGPAFIVFLVAISFHQSFEGLALGSRIAAVQFPRTSFKPWLMVLAYGMTTPIGQAIGLIVHRMYDPQSMGGLLVVGFMNAISSGLLLYAGLVQLLAEDFLTDKSYKVLKGRKRLAAYLAVCLGALMMAIVGAWA